LEERNMPRQIGWTAFIVAMALWTPGLSGRQGPATTALSDQDRTELQQLAGRYARALGTCSADEYADLFATPDGYFASGTSGKVLGHKMLADLVLGQAHCINDTAIGGGPRNTTATGGRGTGAAGVNGRGGGNGPALTIETSEAGVTGRSTLRDHGHYEDVYIKTAQGWRFKSRTHLSAEQEQAHLTPQDYEDIRALAGDREYKAVYVDTPKGPRFKSAGLVIVPSPDGAAGTAVLAGGGRYDDVYVKGPAGWRFKSRTYVP
jgi:hypothetical protein